MPASDPILPEKGAPDARPLFSVMIPAYNCTDYIRQALGSVLAQDPGLERMHIEVIDDASTEDLRSVIEEIGHGRVAYHRQPRNVGLLENMNTCIDRAQGEWVHILHADDYVLPGFYAEVEALIRANPTIGAVAIPCHYVDSVGAILSESENFAVPDWQETLRRAFLRGTPVQFVGMLVRREVYIKVGRFRAEFPHMADAEMWSRLLFHYESAFSSRCLCCYRIHDANASSKLIQNGRNITERSEVLPFLVRNANLSPADESTYRAELHRLAYVQCLRFAHSGRTAHFRDNLVAYARSTITTAERVLFVRRAVGMILVHALHPFSGKPS